MRYLVFAFGTLVTLCLLSCDPCNNLDCMYSNYEGQFRIISQTDNKDLVFGPNKIYDINQIRFYSLNGTDTSYFETKTIYAPGTGYDSILSVYFFPTSPTAYMRLSNGDVDTLNLAFHSINSKCCGTVTDINNFRLNNKIDMGNNSTTREIKK